MKNWVAEDVASDVNDFKSYAVQTSGLKDDKTIFRCSDFLDLWTMSKIASRKIMISIGERHSFVPFFSIMSHLTSRLKPQFGSTFSNASSKVGKASCQGVFPSNS